VSRRTAVGFLSMTRTPELIVYVDIDGTLVRSFGAKRIPMMEMVRHVRDLHRDGASLYAWLAPRSFTA
jgi:hypothetical protein